MFDDIFNKDEVEKDPFAPSSTFETPVNLDVFSDRDEEGYLVAPKGFDPDAPLWSEEKVKADDIVEKKKDPSLLDSAKAGFGRTMAGGQLLDASYYAQVLNTIHEFDKPDYEYDPREIQKRYPHLKTSQMGLIKDYFAAKRVGTSDKQWEKLTGALLDNLHSSIDWNTFADQLGTNPEVLKIAEAMKVGGVESAKALVKNISVEAFGHFMAASLGAFVPNAPYMMIPMGGALGAFVRQGIASGKTDFESEVSQALAEKGINPQDELGAITYLGSEEFEEWRRRKMARAAAVGFAAGGGGAFAHAVGGSGVKKIAGEFIAGATTDAAGEAVGQKLADPDDPINWGEVLLEAGMGGPQQIVESTIGAFVDGKKSSDTDKELSGELNKAKDKKGLDEETKQKLDDLEESLKQAKNPDDGGQLSLWSEEQERKRALEKEAADPEGKFKRPTETPVEVKDTSTQLDFFDDSDVQVAETVQAAQEALSQPTEQDLAQVEGDTTLEMFDPRPEPPMEAYGDVQVEDAPDITEPIHKQWEAINDLWDSGWLLDEGMPVEINDATKAVFEPIIRDSVVETDEGKIIEAPLELALENLLGVVPEEAGLHQIAKRALGLMREMHQAQGVPMPKLRIATPKELSNIHGSNFWSPGVKGGYDAGRHTIFLKASGLPHDNGLKLETLVHETVHSVTSYLLENIKDDPLIQQKYPKLVELNDALTDARRQIMQFIKDNDVNDDGYMKALVEQSNALQNNHEILAWLANRRFRNFLAEIPDNKPASILKRLLNKWFAAVKEVFGIKKADESMLARVLNIYGELTDFNWIKSEFNMQDFILEEGSAPYLEPLAHRTAPNILNTAAYDFKQAMQNYMSDYNAAKAMSGGNMVKAPFEHEMGILTAALNADKAKSGSDSYIKQVTYITDFGALDKFLKTGNPGLLQSARPNPVPYVYLRTKKGSILVQMFDDPSMLMRLKSNYKNQRIYSVSEAANTIAKGMVTDEAVRTWRRNDGAQRALDMLNKITKNSTTSLEEFEDIDDPYVAKQMLLKDGKDLKQNITDPWSAGVEGKAALTNNPLLRWWRGAVTKMIRSQEEMRDSVVKPIMWDYRKLTKNEQMATMKALLLGDRYQVELTPDMLRTRGFNDLQIDIVQRFYEADKWILEQGNLIRKKWGLEPTKTRPGHFPGIFNDDYSSLITVDGKPVGVVGGNTNAALEHNKKLMQQKFPTAKFGRTQIRTMASNRGEYAEMNAVYDVLEEILDPNDPNVQKAKQANVEAGTDIAVGHLGFGKFHLDKKGIVGNVGNKPWKSDWDNSEEQFMFAMNYLSQGAFHYGVMDNMIHLTKLLKDPELIASRPNTLKYLHAQLYHLTNKMVGGASMGATSKSLVLAGQAIDTLFDGALQTVGLGKTYPLKASSQLREAFSYMAMSFYNVAFGALQFGQVIQTAMPLAAVYRQRLGINITEARDAPVKAAMQMMKMVIMTRTSYGNKKHKENFRTHPWYKELSQEDKVLIQHILENGMLEFGTVENTSSTVVRTDTATEKFKHHSDIARRLPEKMTRPYVFFWLYNVARHQGIDMKKAMEIAQHGTQLSMVHYHQAMRPMVYSMLGNMGHLLGQLKTFMHGFITMNAYLVKNGKKSYNGVLALLAGYVVLTGVEGILGFEELDKLLRSANRHWNGSNYSLKDATKEYLPDILRMGLLSYATGRDFYSRARVPSLLEWETHGSPALGWFSDTMGYVYDIWDSPDDKLRWKMLFNTVSPTSVRSAISDPLLRSNEHGDLLDKNGRILFYNYFDSNNYDVIRRLGFRRPEESETFREAKRTRDNDMYYDNRRTRISRELAHWMARGQPMNHPKVQEWVKEYIKLYGTPSALFANAKKQMYEFRADFKGRSQYMNKGLRSARQTGLDEIGK